MSAWPPDTFIAIVGSILDSINQFITGSYALSTWQTPHRRSRDDVHALAIHHAFNSPHSPFHDLGISIAADWETPSPHAQRASHRSHFGQRTPDPHHGTGEEVSTMSCLNR